MYYLICLCMFIILNSCNYYSICATLNFVGTFEEFTKIVGYLKSKFEMKILRKHFFFFIGLLIKYLSNKILVYWSTYIKKILKHFHVDKSHSLSYLVIVHSLEVKNDLFYHKEDNEKLFGLEVLYYSVNVY